METACFEVTFTIPGSSSLKDKRMVVKSLIERCKSRFNVSVVECGEYDKWQLAQVGFALAAINASSADHSAQKIIDFLYADDRINISGIERY